MDMKSINESFVYEDDTETVLNVTGQYLLYTVNTPLIKKKSCAKYESIPKYQKYAYLIISIYPMI